MTDTDASKTIHVAHDYSVPPARVFDAWVVPAVADKWLFATPTGTMQRVEIDPRPGGRLEIVERRDGEDVAHVGAFVRVERPRLVEFDFSVPKYSSVSTRVTVEIAPTAGGCTAQLTHAGVLPEWAERTAAGWAKLLDGLGQLLAAGE